MPITVTAHELDDRVEMLTYGCEYRDQQLATSMRARRRDRLGRERTGPLASTSATSRPPLTCISVTPSPCGACDASSSSATR